MINSRTMLKAAILIGMAVLFAGCYTMLWHPEIAEDRVVEEEPDYEAPMVRSRSCSDCHTTYYGDPYYHWPFHYYDPPVGSWFYGRRFYGRPFYSVTYYHRHRYYSAYPWWWNSRFYSGYRYREPARYIYPKTKPEKRDWDRRSGFDRPLPTVGSEPRKRETSSGTAQPKESVPHFTGRRSTSETSKSVSQTSKSTTQKKAEEDNDDEEDKKEKKKRSSRRKGMQ